MTNGEVKVGPIGIEYMITQLATATIAEGHQSHTHATITELFNNLPNRGTMHPTHNALDLIVANIEVGARLDGQTAIFRI